MFGALGPIFNSGSNVTEEGYCCDTCQHGKPHISGFIECHQEPWPGLFSYDFYCGTFKEKEQR